MKLRKSKYAYPFNMIQDILSLSDEQMEKYMSNQPADLEATLQYVFLQYLSETERKIMYMAYAKDMTLVQVGQLCGGVNKEHVTPEYVRQTIHRVIRKIKHSKKANLFIQYGIIGAINKIKKENDQKRQESYKKPNESISENPDPEENNEIEIEELELTVRTYNALRRAGIRYVSQIPRDFDELAKKVKTINECRKEVLEKLRAFEMTME